MRRLYKDKMDYSKISFTLFLTVTILVQVSGQNAKINAPAQFILNTDRIQIDCQPAGSMYNHIYALSILKNNRPMVSVGRSNGLTSIAWYDSGVQNRATTNTPNLDSLSTAQLRVTIEATNTQCDDQAMYTCRVAGLDSNFNVVPNNEVSANISVVVKPDRMDEIVVSPAAGQYSEEQNITLFCTGTVGAYIHPLSITWCIQRNGDIAPSDLESDSYIRSITQSNAQAVGSGPTTSCQFERTSTVVYEVTNIDTDTTFWCQITAPGDSPICGQGTVRQQQSIEVVQTTMSTGSKDQAQTTMSIASTDEVSGQNARINAPAQFILNTDRIEIDCQPAGSMYVMINALSILKNNRPMVSVGKHNGQTSIVWSDSGVQSRATTNIPNLDTVSTAQLRVIIEPTNTQCDDQAMYTCKVNGLDYSFVTVPNNEASANISVVVKPDRMDEMLVSNAAGQYSEEQNITLSCTGTVGPYIHPLSITWCIQRNGDIAPSDLKSDSYFRSITQSNAQAVGSGPTTSCQFERTSTVVYEVANIDTNTTFWCQITAPGDSPICGQGTVRQQQSIEVAQTTMSTGSKDQDQTTMSIGSTDKAQTTMSIGSTDEVQKTMSPGSEDEAQTTVISGSGLQRHGGIVTKLLFCFLFLMHFMAFRFLNWTFVLI